jgi:hypothetical protein
LEIFQKEGLTHELGFGFGGVVKKGKLEERKEKICAPHHPNVGRGLGVLHD